MDDEELQAILDEASSVGDGKRKKEYRSEVQGSPPPKKPGFFESVEAAAAPGIKQAKEGLDKVSGADVARGAGRVVTGALMGPAAGGAGPNLLEDALILAAKPFGEDAVSKVRGFLGVNENDPGTIARGAEFVGKMGEGLGKLGSDAVDYFAGRETEDATTLAGLAGGAVGGTIGGIARGADPRRVGALSREDPYGQLTAAADVAGLGMGGGGVAAKAVGGASKRLVPGVRTTRTAVGSGGLEQPLSSVQGLAKSQAKLIDDAGGLDAVRAAERFTPDELRALRNQAISDKFEALQVLNPPKKAARSALERRMSQRGLTPDEIPPGFEGPLGGGTDWDASLPPPPNASMVSDIGTGGARPGNVKGMSFPEVPDAPKTAISEVPAPVTGIHKPAGIDFDWMDPTMSGSGPGPMGAEALRMQQAKAGLAQAENLVDMVGKHERASSMMGGKTLQQLQDELLALQAMSGKSPLAPTPLAAPAMSQSYGAPSKLGPVLEAVSDAVPGKYARVGKALSDFDQSGVGMLTKMAGGGAAGGLAGGLAGAGVGAAVPLGLAMVKALVKNPLRVENAMARLVEAGKIAPGMTLTAETAQALGQLAERDPEARRIVEQSGVLQ